MPKISNILICDMPISFDTYEGCSHACNYCFVKLKKDISKINVAEGKIALLNFIKKRKDGEHIFGLFDYDIPIHWGGLSDPFQPIEKQKKISIECLKIFEETQYPFVISTKSDLIADDEYLNILKRCNCAVQFSAVCSAYDDVEKGATKFIDRIKAIEKISKYKRVIIRAQPLIPSIKNEFIKNIKLFKDVGVYGITIEFMKYKCNYPKTIKIAGDYVYPLEIIKPIFDEVKIKANEQGIKVFAGENRLRQFGDGLNCCGVGDMWRTHTENLNHILWDKFKFNPIHNNKKHHQIIIGGQDTRSDNLQKSLSYNEIIKIAIKDRSILNNYFLDKIAIKNIKKLKELNE